MISTLAVRFASVSVHDIDQVITDSLRLIGENFHVDQCTLGRFYNGANEVRITHGWRSQRNGRRRSDDLFEPKTHPWYVSQLMQGNSVVMRRLTDHTPAAEQDRRVAYRSGKKSIAAIPILHGRQCIGYVALSSYRREINWGAFAIKRLQATVNIMGAALSRVRSEEMVEQHKFAQAQLRYALYRSSRISTMGGMTAALAHEINQPLAAILANAQAAQRFLNMPAPSIEEFRNITTDIIDDTKRARDVMLKVRSIFQKERGDLVELDINVIIQELYPLLHSQLLIGGIEFKQKLQDGLPTVHGDAIQLQQVILNFLFNGIEAMKNRDQRQLHIVSGLSEDNGSVVVSVINSGPAISARDMPHIFEPFFTTKNEGMGMGLAINKAIVIAHGGQIKAENNLKQGVTFSFTLPVRQLVAH